MSLASNRLIAQMSAGIRDYTKQQHSGSQLRTMFFAATVHHDRIDGIRTCAFRITKTAANIVEPTKLRLGPKDSIVVAKSQLLAIGPHAKHRIEMKEGYRISIVSQFRPRHP